MYQTFTNTTTKDGTWGNKMGYVLFPLHIKHKRDPLDYVRKAHAMMQRKKESLEPLFTSLLANLVLKLFGVKVLIVCLVGEKSFIFLGNFFIGN